mgnify:CR=1 FL=1
MLEKIAKWLTRKPKLVAMMAVLMLIPAAIGYISTRINYDILSYLPEDLESSQGEKLLEEPFKMAATSMLVVESMPAGYTNSLLNDIKAIDGVSNAIWISNLMGIQIPTDMIPANFRDMFFAGDATMMIIQYSHPGASDETMEAIEQVRRACNEKCFLAGFSVVIKDTRDLMDSELPIFVGLAVLLALVAMMVTLESMVLPFIFLASIGFAVIYNFGSNIFLGEISYITKAIAAVLQLGVTMDYSIFLWHSYNEQREKQADNKEAMACAIHETLTSVIGSSVTTVAGFAALCFMTFTLGRDLGLVMAKGVIFGVIGCVTVLPALILVLDKPLQATRHRSLIPDMKKFAGGVARVFPVFLVIFAILIPPALYGYNKTTDEVYYDMGQCLPEDMEYVIANSKLSEEFDIASTHMVLVNAKMPARDVRAMMDEMEQVDGVKYVLGLESVIGTRVPEEILPDSIRSILKSDRWELLLINSEYKVASDAVNQQITSLNSILKKYDSTGMLIGEAPCMKDMIDTTDRDFQVVNAVSIVAIFVIIALVEQSALLPFILIAVIELAIFINLGLPHYLGQSLPFIAPICISTIQLGATVDYAILMTTRYKAERIRGNSKHDSVVTALTASIPSIIVSGLGLFAATFGVAVYSDIDIISSMCMLMARGALVSMLCVIFLLPALLLLCDKPICATTIGMRHIGKGTKTTDNGNESRDTAKAEVQ